MKYIIAIISIICSLKVGLSQSILNNPIIVPPSPAVASFQQIDLGNVDLYKGLPSVNIPIYEISSKDFKFPITLSYNYSGFKVEELAGWLGLGWHINAGGVISHIVRGKPDEDPNYGYNWVRNELGIPDPVNNPTGYSSLRSAIAGDKNTLRMFADGLYDGIPDSYAVSANTLKGDLIDIGNEEYISNPYKHYIIYRSGNYWEVIDDAGNKYVFGNIVGDPDLNYGLEHTSYEYSSSTNSWTEVESYISSWFLRVIITNTNEIIKFNYAPETIERIPSISESRFKRTEIGSDCPNLVYSYSLINYNPETTWRLSSIESSSCIISFHSNTAKLDRTPGSTTSSLDSILIKDYKNNLVKKIVFNYDYIGDASDYETCRQLLKTVTEFGEEDASPLSSYAFEYDESVSVPSYFSKSQDFWGFYNGKPNTTLTPSDIPNSNYNDYFQGYANRYPDSFYSKLGLLQKVTLPTKGEISYTYEPNEYGYIKGAPNPSVPVVAGTSVITASVVQGSSTLSDTKRVIIPDGQSVAIQYSINDNGYPLLESGEISITTFVGQPPIYSVKSNNISGTKVLTLSAGIYFITAKVYTIGHSASISLSYKNFEKDANGNIVYNKNLLAAGNRLKKMVQYDGLSHLNDKVSVYNYSMVDEPDRSSGVIHSPIDYDFTTTAASVYLLAPNYYPMSGQFCSFAGRMSSTRAPLFGNDGHIGYQNVTVQEGENGENGSTQYYFTAFADLSFPGLSQSISKAYKRGKLKKMVTKDQTGNIKYTKENYFTSDHANESGVAGLFLVEYEKNNVQDYLDVFKEPYWGIIRSEWYYMHESVETHFSEEGNIIDRTFYSYTNPLHAQLTNVRREMSDGKELEINYYYPSDYPTGTQTSTAVMYSLESKNMQVKLKMEKMVDNNIVDGQIVNYGTNFLPSSLSILENGTYQPRTHFNQYDEFGNLLEVIDRDGITTSYLWSYNDQYPVVTAENIDYNTLKSAVESAANTTDLETFWGNLPNVTYSNSTWTNFNNSLRNNAALQDAMVTTYTYDPLVGMTSATDANGITTYYEYDNFGRLHLTKDDDEAIMNRYNYNYKQ